MPPDTSNNAEFLYGSPQSGEPQQPLSSTLQAELLGALEVVEPIQADNRLTGERQTFDVLMWLHRFGWLTSRMLAALVWPTASQSWPMARRKLKRLLADKLVLVRALPQGGDVYLLSVKGARLLQEATGALAKSGQTLPTGNTIHRACGNWYLIAQVQAGLGVWTEHEIASGVAPVHTVNGKLFDGLVVHDGGLVTACEVENAWKNRSRRYAVVDVARRHLGKDGMTRIGVDADGLELYLARLAVVSASTDALRSMAASFQEAYRLRLASEMCLACVDVAIQPVSPSLVPGEVAQGNLWWDVMQPHSLS